MEDYSEQDHLKMIEAASASLRKIDAISAETRVLIAKSKEAIRCSRKLLTKVS